MKASGCQFWKQCNEAHRSSPAAIRRRSKSRAARACWPTLIGPRRWRQACSKSWKMQRLPKVCDRPDLGKLASFHGRGRPKCALRRSSEQSPLPPPPAACAASWREVIERSIIASLGGGRSSAPLDPSLPNTRRRRVDDSDLGDIGAVAMDIPQVKSGNLRPADDANQPRRRFFVDQRQFGLIVFDEQF